jgi:hypothetical protein
LGWETSSSPPPPPILQMGESEAEGGVQQLIWSCSKDKKMRWVSSVLCSDRSCTPSEIGSCLRVPVWLFPLGAFTKSLKTLILKRNCLPLLNMENQYCVSLGELMLWR